MRLKQFFSSDNLNISNRVYSMFHSIIKDWRNDSIEITAFIVKQEIAEVAHLSPKWRNRSPEALLVFEECTLELYDRPIKKNKIIYPDHDITLEFSSTKPHTIIQKESIINFISQLIDKKPVSNGNVHEWSHSLKNESKKSADIESPILMRIVYNAINTQNPTLRLSHFNRLHKFVNIVHYGNYDNKYWVLEFKH